jgi:hypothetical protein
MSSLSLDRPPTLRAVEPLCSVCEERPAVPGNSQGECGPCWRGRVGSVHSGFAPSKSAGAGQIDPTKSRKFEGRLDDYAAVRAEGAQPRSTKQRHIDEAKRLSDDTGKAFSARSPAADAAPVGA